MTMLHSCSNCHARFGPAEARVHDMSWRSIFYRPVKPLPLGRDIEGFDLVRCPSCGHAERALEIKIFGFISGAHVKHVLWVLLLAILVFGYWIIKS